MKKLRKSLRLWRPLAAALALAGLVSLPAVAGGASSKLDDQAIIAIYNQVNSMDIESGLLGMAFGH